MILRRLIPFAAFLVCGGVAVAAGTNTVSIGNSAAEVGGSVVRMLAGLAFVLALFFGGIWIVRNWQRVSRVRGNHKLNICEARSLGPRQGVYVVGYEQQRFLIAASPAGISLLSELPDAQQGSESVANGAPAPFAQVLQSVLGKR
jgi:flagellar biosynthetic protein FliO